MRGGFYADDLAAVHSEGFGEVAEAAGKVLVELLRAAGLEGGEVLDLGCGDGRTAAVATAHGLAVTGIDRSGSMVERARSRVPEGFFRRGSIWTGSLGTDRFAAVTAVGEVINYRSPSGHEPSLERLFRRVHRALVPGGVFLFDAAAPGRISQDGAAELQGSRSIRRGFHRSEDWAVLVEQAEHRARRTLIRGITTFRRVGQHFRRSHERHRQQLLPSVDVLDALARAGFQARRLSGYGELELPARWFVYLARRRGAGSTSHRGDDP